MEQYLIGGLLGAVFGAAVAWCGAQLTRRSLEKDNTAALMGASFLRMLTDIAALLVLYLLRDVLPFPFYGVIVGAALGLSLVGIVLAARMVKKLGRDETSREGSDSGNCNM